MDGSAARGGVAIEGAAVYPRTDVGELERTAFTGGAIATKTTATDMDGAVGQDTGVPRIKSSTALRGVALETTVVDYGIRRLWYGDGSPVGLDSDGGRCRDGGGIAVEHCVAERQEGVAIGIDGSAVGRRHTVGASRLHGVTHQTTAVERQLPRMEVDGSAHAVRGMATN